MCASGRIKGEADSPFSPTNFDLYPLQCYCSFMKNPLDGQEDSTQVPSEVTTPAETGATILARYQHPGDWVRGNKPHLFGKMVLMTEEIRIGGMAFVDEKTARDNATAIRAWAGSVGLAPFQITIDQQTDKAPYVVVPEAHFANVVLPQLQALVQPQEQ